MSNPTVSLRISNYQLARGLQAIRAIEPTWSLTTASDLLRTVFNDYIAKAERLHSLSFDVPHELVREVEQARLASTEANKKTIALSREKARIKAQSNMLGQPSHLGQRTHLTIPTQTNQLGQTTHTDTRTAYQIMLDEQGEQLMKELRAEKEQEQPEINQADFDQQINLAQTVRHKAPEELPTESEINTVTDFSPPSEWKSE